VSWPIHQTSDHPQLAQLERHRPGTVREYSTSYCHEAIMQHGIKMRHPGLGGIRSTVVSRRLNTPSAFTLDNAKGDMPMSLSHRR
jgi:hypothetical protein